MELPDITLGTAALVVFLACAGYVLVRGVARMLAGLALLAASGWLAFQMWRHAPEISVAFFGKALLPVTLGLPVLVFCGSFWVLLKLGRLILNPFGEKAEAKRANLPRTVGGFVSRLVFAALPAAVICLIAAAVIHFAGAAAEVGDFARKSSSEKQNNLADQLQRLKTQVEQVLPRPVLDFLSPASESSRVAMAKAVIERTLWPDRPPSPVIDPATGKPIPRAVPVDEPELKDLAREGRFGELLRHPSLSPRPAAGR